MPDLATRRLQLHVSLSRWMTPTEAALAGDVVKAAFGPPVRVNVFQDFLMIEGLKVGDVESVPLKLRAPLARVSELAAETDARNQALRDRLARAIDAANSRATE